MADFSFVDEMLAKCDGVWNHSYMLGTLMCEVRMFLRGVKTREELTAFYACFEMAETAHSEHVISGMNAREAAQRVQHFLRAYTAATKTQARQSIRR